MTTRKTVSRKPSSARGQVILIGGHEDKEGDCTILAELARLVGKGKLLVATLATDAPEELWPEYRDVFRRLGVKHIEHLGAADRQELLEKPADKIFDGVTALFFAGGDQLKITTKFAGSPLCKMMFALYSNGGTIAGTSSGASVMGDTMLTSGRADTTPDNNGSVEMAPGLGLLRDVLIDQHFTERGRIGRLVAAVAQNPRMLGIGLDENTAAVCNDEGFTVIGDGSVYIVDGQDIWFTNMTEPQKQKVSVFGLKLHLLSQADHFSTGSRLPQNIPRDEIAAALKMQRDHTVQGERAGH